MRSLRQGNQNLETSDRDGLTLDDLNQQLSLNQQLALNRRLRLPRNNNDDNNFEESKNHLNYLKSDNRTMNKMHQKKHLYQIELKNEHL